MGLKPVFIIENPNLFSDIYRDLVAIGSSDPVPFIVNGREKHRSKMRTDGSFKKPLRSRIRKPVFCRAFPANGWT
jgi:hypothetical protein